MPSNRLNLWSTFRVPPGTCLCWQGGPLSLYLHRDGDDWRVAYDVERGATWLPGLDRVEEPPECDWTHYTFDETADRVTFAPVMPDRPLIVSSETPTVIPPRLRAELYLPLPVWVQLTISGGKRTKGGRGAVPSWVLPAIDPYPLSDTWFGDLFSGELGYSLNTPARHDVDILEHDPLRAVCQMTVFNRSEADLPITRFGVRTDSLAVFLGERRLWANDIYVVHRGTSEETRIKYGDGPNRLVQNAQCLTPARGSKDANLLKLNFAL